MSEKILNTRIQLRYDSFTNWKTPNDGRGALLKKGELAVAYLADAKTAATPDNGTHPIMFKVGPGYFNELPWASALAADVYGWAKKVRGESTDVDYTKTIKTKNEETGVETTTTSTITVQTAIDALYQAIETLSGDSGASIAELITIINKNKEDIADIQGDISDIVAEIGVASVGDAVATGLYAAIEAAQAKADAAYVLPEGGIEEDLSAAVKASLALADSALQDHQDISHLAVKTEVADTYATKQSLADGLAGKADKAAFEAVQETVNNFFSEEAVIEGAIDTLKEIATYIANDKTGATDITGRVGALETKVDVEKVSTAISTAVAGEVTLREEADAAEKKAREDADAEEARLRTAADTALSDRIKAYEDAKDSYATKTALQEVETVAKAAYVLPEGGIEGDLSSNVKASLGKADSALQEITTTENGGLTVTNKNKIDIDTTITFVFDCGDAFGNPLN